MTEQVEPAVGAVRREADRDRLVDADRLAGPEPDAGFREIAKLDGVNPLAIRLQVMAAMEHGDQPLGRLAGRAAAIKMVIA